MVYPRPFACMRNAHPRHLTNSPQENFIKNFYESINTKSGNDSKFKKKKSK